MTTHFLSPGAKKWFGAIVFLALAGIGGMVMVRHLSPSKTAELPDWFVRTADSLNKSAAAIDAEASGVGHLPRGSGVQPAQFSLRLLYLPILPRSSASSKEAALLITAANATAAGTREPFSYLLMLKTDQDPASDSRSVCGITTLRMRPNGCWLSGVRRGSWDDLLDLVDTLRGYVDK